MKSTVRGTMWSYAATYSGKLLVLLSTIILARLLTQEDFGLAGYALVVISFLDVLSDLGIGSAVIYHRHEPKVVNTAFWLNLMIGLALFMLTWLVAPFAAWFFQDPEVEALTRVLGLTFPILALGNIHSSLLRKNLSFKRKFVPDVTKSLGKGITSIVLALAGFGAWSLVIGQLAGTALAVVALWIVFRWRPRLQFDRAAARQLLSYGSNIVSNNALSTFINRGDYLIIGRVLGAAALGVYTLAFRIPELLVKQFCTVLGQVMFPTFSKMQNDPERMRQGFLTTMRYLTLITIPVALGLAAVARPLVLTLFTEKWIEAAPVMAAISIYTLIRSLTFNVGAIYKAQGKPQILSRISVFQLILILPALWLAATLTQSIIAVAWTQVAAAALFGLVNLVIASRLLNLSLGEIFRSFRPALVCGIIMAVIVFTIVYLLAENPPIVQLVVGVLTGALVYSLLIGLTQREVVVAASTNLRLALSRT